MSLQIDSVFTTPLDPKDLFSLIETGIKFFLFQRGQIPVPYERLRVTDQYPDGPLRNINKILDENSLDSISTNERIRMIKVQRRQMRQDFVLAQRDKKLHDLETKARIVFDGVFQNLRSVFLSPYIEHITGVALVFGSSIYHQKEIITFRIDESLKNIHKSSMKGEEEYDFSANVRSFCKAIIMSDEFVDFTDKSLRPTFTHMCLLTNQELADSNLKKELILVEKENYQHLFHGTFQSINNENSQSRLNRKRKSLCITFKKLNKSFPTSHSPSLHEDYENSSTFCYQLPLRYKGIHVRNHPAQ